MMKHGYTYILSNKTRTVLYIGVTSDIELRILQHKTGQGSTFASKYNCTDLLHVEIYPLVTHAIEREKQLKQWHKEWKWNLVREKNPELLDLAADWFDDETLNSIVISP